MRVVVGLLLDGDKVFMTKRAAKGPCPGMWEIPGGKAELSESSEQTLARELYEELGVKVISCRYVSAKEVNFYGNPFTFEVRHVVESIGQPKLLESQQDCGYFTMEHAVNKLACCPSMYVMYPTIRKYMNRKGG